MRWNSELPRGLPGKKKAAAERKAKRQHLSLRDFKDLKKITKVMAVSTLLISIASADLEP
jgi:hypothetical protein